MGNVGSAISTLSSRFTRTEQIQKVEAFAQAQGTALGESNVATLRSVAVRVNATIAWDEKRLSEVRSWLVRKQTGGAASISASITVLLLSLTAYFYIN